MAKLSTDLKHQNACSIMPSLSSLPGRDGHEVQVGVARGIVEHRHEAQDRMRTNTLSPLPGRDRPEVQV